MIKREGLNTTASFYYLTMKFPELSLKTKLILAVATVVISLALGFYTKIMLLVGHEDPFKFWLNVALYIFSWVILFIAGFFVGKETLQMADQSVRKKLQQSYDIAIELQKKGVAKGIETTKKGIETTKKGIETTRHLGRKTIAVHKKILGIEELTFKKPEQEQQKKRKEKIK